MSSNLSRVGRSLALGVLSSAMLAGVALAQPPGFVRVAGVVTAASDDSVTVTAADGTATVLPLDPAWTVVVARPVDIEAIKPGSFVATANDDIGVNEGKSIELRIFEPGSHAGEGSRPMPTPGRTMTNGTVTTVTKGASGRELDVAYPGGTRHIIVPPQVQVIGSFPVARDQVKPGVTISAFAVKGDDGVARATRVQIAGAVAKP
jgi:hypothetical protein